MGLCEVNGQELTLGLLGEEKVRDTELQAHALLIPGCPLPSPLAGQALDVTSHFSECVSVATRLRVSSLPSKARGTTTRLGNTGINIGRI